MFVFAVQGSECGVVNMVLLQMYTASRNLISADDIRRIFWG